MQEAGSERLRHDTEPLHLPVQGATPVGFREKIFAYVQEQVQATGSDPSVKQIMAEVQCSERTAKQYRREAIAAHVWPINAQMLRSNGDFFAMTAGAYLAGVTTREPYTRAHLQKTQPGYYQWLAKLFDDGVARR